MRCANFRSVRCWIPLAGLLALAAGLPACTSQFFSYITEERQGNVQFLFVNNTDARAAFTFGTFDSLDRDPPGTVTVQQLRLESGASSGGVSIPCRRDAAIATAQLVTRVVQTDADRTLQNFDADAFDETVHFSTAPANSAAAALPNAGTAAGVNKQLGVDFTCGDTLIFTFQNDPDAPGGYRIDFSVIRDVEPDDQSRS